MSAASKSVDLFGHEEVINKYTYKQTHLNCLSFTVYEVQPGDRLTVREADIGALEIGFRFYPMGAVPYKLRNIHRMSFI